MVSIPMGWIVATGIAAALFLALWIATLLSRRWYVTLRKSAETELLGLYLSRIADALERLASAREARAESAIGAPDAVPNAAPEETAPVGAGAARHVTFSMLGR